MPARKLTRSLAMPLSRILVPSPEYRASSAPAPTYATWNPADKGATVVLSGGDLGVTSGSGGTWNGSSVRATIGKSSGKWQFEVEIGALSGATVAVVVGVGKSTASLASFLGSDANGWGYFGANGNKINNSTLTAFGAVFNATDVITCYYDADTGTVGYLLNGADQGTIASGLTGEVFPMLSVYSSTITTLASFGEVALQHPKAGYNERWASS